jgi:poly-beta-hydroxyalkanoate depolymerase
MKFVGTALYLQTIKHKFMDFYLSHGPIIRLRTGIKEEENRIASYLISFPITKS